jgi:hypothetical protein
MPGLPPLDRMKLQFCLDCDGCKAPNNQTERFIIITFCPAV